jgi:class 3 adenylate cyclase
LSAPLNSKALYDGPFDSHDPAYGYTERRIPFYSYSDASINDVPKHSAYTFSVYSTSELEKQYKTHFPRLASIAVVITFATVISAILLYDWFVCIRDSKVKLVAVVSSDMVSSYLPANVRNEIIEEHRCTDTGRLRLASKSGPDQERARHPKPLASLFLDTTVLYADIAGFTEWSAMRNPEQVFELLETLFRTFDKIARRLGVYKVETVGDCYIAVTGLPEPQPDHAKIMVLFAVECLQKMKSVITKLRERLGQGTEDLSMRIGLCSGHVTAGVLRGSRARFQLFGDTVYRAAHIERTGSSGRIHVSEETAQCLRNAGKGQWLTPREDKILVGAEISTYWVSVEALE